MKKIINLLAFIAITPLVSFAQNTQVEFGSDSAGSGGGFMFSDATEVSLVRSSGGSLVESSLSVTPTVGFTDFTFSQTAPGYANGSFNLTGTSPTDYAGTPWLRITNGTLTSYITDSTWTAWSSVGAGTPTPILGYMLGASTNLANLTVEGADLTFTAGAGNFGSGYGVSFSVVPEPSTYALIAGFAAFVFVAIRRRK